MGAQMDKDKRDMNALKASSSRASNTLARATTATKKLRRRSITERQDPAMYGNDIAMKTLEADLLTRRKEMDKKKREFDMAQRKFRQDKTRLEREKKAVSLEKSKLERRVAEVETTSRRIKQ